MDRSVENLLRLVEQEGLLDDRDMERLVLAAGLSRNEHVRNAAAKSVYKKYVEHRRYPFDSVDPTGKVDIGESGGGRRVRLSEDDVVKHLLAVGQSGSGKTTLLYQLMDQLGVPYWAFDLKQDFRHLVQHDGELLVLPWTEFRFNPLKPPPGVPPRRWIQVFAEVFGHSTALLSGSKNHLMNRLVELYRFYNLFEDVSEPYPSLHELAVLVRREKINYVRKQSDYRDRILNRLEAMNLTAGTVFDCSQGYSIENLLDRDVVFEFDGLSRDVQNFLMEILFAYVYEYRMAQNQRGDGLRHVFFLDEGKRVFSVYKERQDAAGIPEVDELTAKMREFGEGLVVADQEASKLTDSIKANTYTKVLLPTGDRKQFRAMAESMNLSERQAEYAQELAVGEAVVQVGNRDPVPVTLDDYRLEKQVTDDYLERLQTQQWNQLSHTPRDSTPEFEQWLLSNDPEEIEDTEIVDDPPENVDISQEAQRLLEDVIEHPFKPLTERYERFSSQYKGNMAKNEVVDAGIVIERHVRNSERKRKLLQLTEKGRNYAEESLDLDVERQGRGGIVHRFWQHRIKDTFEEAGWDAFLEKFDADVYVNMDDQELAIEVAMGDNPREIEHVEKHLDRGFQVWVACRNGEVLDGLEERVQEKDVESYSLVFRLFRQL